MRFLKTILAMNMFHFVTVCASLLCRYPEWKFKSDVSTLQAANFLSIHLSIPGKVPSMYILVLNFFFFSMFKVSESIEKKIQNRKRTDGHVYNVILTFHCDINTKKTKTPERLPNCVLYTPKFDLNPRFRFWLFFFLRRFLFTGKSTKVFCDGFHTL